jgi:hypothetical protein
VTLALWATSAARADLIAWTHSWSNSPQNIYADSPGGGSISLTNGPGANDSSVVATNLQIHTNTTAANPDAFAKKTYSLSLTLKDTASGANGNVVFTGQLDSNSSSGDASITNTFTSPGVQTLQLGANQYAVTVRPYVPPGPANPSNTGSIGGFTIGVDVRLLPEPHAVLLGILGASLVSLTGWRRGSR